MGMLAIIGKAKHGRFVRKRVAVYRAISELVVHGAVSVETTECAAPVPRRVYLIILLN